MGRAMLFILYIMSMFFLLFLIKLCCAGIACAKVISVVDDKGRQIDIKVGRQIDRWILDRQIDNRQIDMYIIGKKITDRQMICREMISREMICREMIGRFIVR